MYNRGVKRDAFGNRNFNNQRMGGGGGGGSGGGRSGNMVGGMGGGMGGGVNPWESGMMPGRGILPTPSNNLSLASPQAQLAIASNLLSNILRTQQESQPQVPSLLSLGNNYGGPGQNYNNQQSYQQRYNDRPARQNMKNQRPQPYNKMGNNRAREGATSGRRGPSAQHSRASGNQRINGSQNQHRNDKSSKANAASKNQGAKKEQQGDKSNKASDKTKEKADPSVAESQENDESVENKKRDWNEERKEGDSAVKSEENQDGAKETDAKSDSKEDKENKVDENKDGDIKDSEEKKDSSKPPVKKSEARHAESRYADVPMSHMFCHVCNKHMWDGSSFENHLRGRAHKLMMEKLDESYKLKVDLMRHDLRVTEEQRELSLTNSKRRGRKVGIDLNVREYCTMCDLNFYGTLSSHRKSEKHQQLKTFLHPRCTACVKEFPSRIEYDEHCLTPQHMKSAVQNEEQRKGNKKKDKLAKGESEVRTAEDEDKDVGTESKNDKPEETTENVEYVTDIDETTKENITNLKAPSYKYCRQKQVSIGKSMVKEVQGFYCEKCRRFMLLPEDMASHLRTITHYRNFIQEVKALTAATAEAEKLQTKEESDAPNDTTATESEEYEGNWKRRKVVHSDDEDNADQKKPEASEDQSEEDPKKVVGEEEKYDPMEAENESEEEEAPVTEEAKGEEAVEGEEEEQQNDEDPKSKDDKVDWSDGENEFEPEVGNLMDESMDDKEAAEQDTSTKSEKPGTPKTVAAAAARGRPNQRARGQRARRSRR